MKTRHTLKRREFLRRSTAAAAGLMVAPSFATDPPPLRYDPFETIPLGKSGLKLSRLCMGTGVRGGNRQSNHTRMGRENCEALMRSAFERGVRTFDLADMYGTHPFLIPALKSIPRDKFAIVTKIWFRPGGIPEKERPNADILVERFLKELNTDYIDLLLLHCVESPTGPPTFRTKCPSLRTSRKKVSFAPTAFPAIPSPRLKPL